MKRKNNPKFNKTTMRLKDNHTWKAPDGYKIVVLDRGAVSFNIPATWIVAKVEPFEMHDNEPPNDDARLSVTYWKFPPGIDWSGLPIEPLLIQSTENIGLEVIEKLPPVRSKRTDIELVWVQHKFIDPVEKRDAYSRSAFARGFDVQVLITMDLWVDDAVKLQHVWDEVLRSLQLGREIADPTLGEITQ
jgi:hypothetical protein